jgi:hypothetical protein
LKAHEFERRSISWVDEYVRTLSEGASLTNPRMRRAAIAAALATSLLAAFAALGGVGVAQSAISSAQYQYGNKVTICHKGHTISVGKAAEPAHVRHGDTVGTCAAAKAKKAKAAKAKAAAAKAKAAEKKQDDGSSDKPGHGNGNGKGGKG